MSAESAPITFERFSKALTDLPVSSLYAKHAELTNQITHLESSNAQLEEFAREHDDRDCYEALLENKQVIKRFEERKDAIMNEVRDVRGLPWRPRGEDAQASTSNGAGVDRAATAQEQPNGEDLRNGDGENGDGENGVFL